MSPGVELSFIVLAFDDAPTLPQVARDACDVLAGLAERFEVLLVDDGSRDDTAAVIRALEDELEPVRGVFHPKNRGVGAAFASGVAAARYEVIGYTDGDGQYQLEDLAGVLAGLEGVDACSGYREHRADPFWRTVASRTYGALLGVVFGLGLRDNNCALKLYTRRFLEASRPQISDGPFYDAEVFARGQGAGFRVAEVPIRHLPRRFGRQGGVRVHTVLWTLVEMGDPGMRRWVRRGWLAAGLFASLALVRLGAAWAGTPPVRSGS